MVYVGNTGLHTCYVRDSPSPPPDDPNQQLWYNIVDRKECCYQRQGSVTWGIVIIVTDAVIASALAAIACCQRMSPGSRRRSTVDVQPGPSNKGGTLREAHVVDASFSNVAIGRREDSGMEGGGGQGVVVVVVQP